MAVTVAMTNSKENIQFGADDVSRQCKNLNLIQWIRNGLILFGLVDIFFASLSCGILFPLYVSNYKPYLWIFGRLFHCTPVFLFLHSFVAHFGNMKLKCHTCIASIVSNAKSNQRKISNSSNAEQNSVVFGFSGGKRV